MCGITVNCRRPRIVGREVEDFILRLQDQGIKKKEEIATASRINYFDLKQGLIGPWRSFWSRV